jgi:hypothetical protein
MLNNVKIGKSGASAMAPSAAAPSEARFGSCSGCPNIERVGSQGSKDPAMGMAIRLASSDERNHTRVGSFEAVLKGGTEYRTVQGNTCNARFSFVMNLVQHSSRRFVCFLTWNFLDCCCNFLVFVE